MFGNRTILSALVAAGLPLAAIPLQAQQTVEGVTFKSKALVVEIGGRVQTQFNTTSVEDEPTTDWLLRRVRLEAKVKVNDIVSGKVQPDFASDRVSLKDAYLELNFAPGLQVLAGKAFRPFSLLTQVSSTQILPIERGARIRGIRAIEEQNLVERLGYADRDIGLQVMGKPAGAPLGFAYAAGVFEGPLNSELEALENSPVVDSRQYAARISLEPVTDLTVGAGWSSREFLTGSVGEPETERGNAFEIDLEYGGFNPGLHLLGEVAFGDFNGVGTDFNGAQVWLAYRTHRVGRILEAIEPVLRASYGDVSFQDSAFEPTVNDGTLLTPGINFYFGGRNRVIFNYDIWMPNEEVFDTESSFKAMFQLAF